MHRDHRKPVDAVIMRASQLDAARLDNELTAMLREQFMSVFSLFQPVSPREDSPYSPSYDISLPYTNCSATARTLLTASEQIPLAVTAWDVCRE